MSREHQLQLREDVVLECTLLRVLDVYRLLRSTKSHHHRQEEASSLTAAGRTRRKAEGSASSLGMGGGGEKGEPFAHSGYIVAPSYTQG